MTFHLRIGRHVARSAILMLVIYNPVSLTKNESDAMHWFTWCIKLSCGCLFRWRLAVCSVPDTLTLRFSWILIFYWNCYNKASKLKSLYNFFVKGICIRQCLIKKVLAFKIFIICNFFSWWYHIQPREFYSYLTLIFVPIKINFTRARINIKHVWCLHLFPGYENTKFFYIKFNYKTF